MGSQRELKFGIIHTKDGLCSERYIMIQRSINIIFALIQIFSESETMFSVFDKKKKYPPPPKKKK